MARVDWKHKKATKIVPKKCAVARFVLSDFAPGKGEITIAADINGAKATTGTIEFAVNPIYHGMFTFGGVWSRLQDPSFGLVLGRRPR